MTDVVCVSCRRSKATGNFRDCGICGEPVCKSCEFFLEEGSFSFLTKLPEELSHTWYCTQCRDTHVEPAQENYRELMERAKEVFFFFTTQKMNLVPLIKQAKEQIRVKACADRDETILRLAFLAAEQGYNAVIQAEVKSEKVRNAGYQTSLWHGVGVPAQVDAVRLEKKTPRLF